MQGGRGRRGGVVRRHGWGFACGEKGVCRAGHTGGGDINVLGGEGRYGCQDGT